MLSVSTQVAQGDSLKLFEEMLKSVSFADELIIHNMERKDTEFFALAVKYHAKVIEIKTPKVVEVVRGQEIENATHAWVLIMDGDEIITKDLAAEILELVKAVPRAYAIRRRNYSLGHSLTHGGWGDDYVPRLFHKTIFMSWPTTIHSVPIVQGEIAKTKAIMEHHKDESLEQMVKKTNRYSEIESSQYLAGCLSPVTSITLMRKWWMESLRRGIIKLGFLDGAIGVIQSMYQGFSVFTSYAKLYEKQISSKSLNNSTDSDNSK
jgi:hypothetical protein